MEILLVTNLWPRETVHLATGVFVKEQVETVRRLYPDVRFDLLLIRGQENKANYLLAAYRVRKAVRAKKYDLIHAHYGLSAVAAVLRGHVPLLVTLHGTDVTAKGFQATLSRWASRYCADGVVVVSNQMKAMLGRNDAVVMPMGVDLELFRPMDREQARTELGLSRSARLVLFAGDPGRALKRYDLFSQAVRLVQAEDPSVQPFVPFSSYYPHEEVPAILNACDVLVMTSDVEGSPMVVKEAMACNIPIVSVPVGDVPELIGGVDGCYVVARDPVAIAQGIRMALERGGRTNGRQAIAHLSAEAIADRLVELYYRIASRDERSERNG